MKTRKNFKKLPYLLKSRTIRNHTNIDTNKNKLVKQGISKEQHLQQLETAFRQGYQEYINLFRECPEALVYTNIDGIIVHVNHCFEGLTGYREDELKGKALVYCLKPEERSFFETASKEFIETTIRGKNNTRIEISVNRAFNQTDNRLAGMIFSFQDIYRRKRERKTNQTLYRISHLASLDIPLQELYPQVHAQLGEIIDATNFYIAISGSGQEQLSFPYYTDEAAGDDEIFINRYSSFQSIFHYILKNGKPVLMDFQRYRKMLSYGYIEPWDVMTNTHLWLGVPIKVGHKVIGVIALQSYNNARLYSEKDLDLLEFVSQQLSAAIYRKALEGKLEQLRQEQEKTDNEGRIPETTRSNRLRDNENKKEDFYLSDKDKQAY
jgi:PAS domain S-box-containing protein